MRRCWNGVGSGEWYHDPKPRKTGRPYTELSTFEDQALAQNPLLQHQVLSLQPNTITYNSVISAAEKSGRVLCFLFVRYGNDLVKRSLQERVKQFRQWRTRSLSLSFADECWLPQNIRILVSRVLQVNHATCLSTSCCATLPDSSFGLQVWRFSFPPSVHVLFSLLLSLPLFLFTSRPSWHHIRALIITYSYFWGAPFFNFSMLCFSNLVLNIQARI